MSMFSSYWKCNYDDYPRFYREVFEMDAILRAEGGLADGALSAKEKMLMNNFIDTMDEDALAKLEEFLDIAMMRERTADERRRFIKSFIAGLGKVSQTRIAEMIRAYTNVDAVCDFYPFGSERNNRLDIKFERGSVPVIYINDIYTLLSKMLPAHIEYRAILTYRFGVGVNYRRKHYKYGYEFCGTKPYSILIGDIESTETVVKPKIRPALIDYKRSSESGEKAGQYPQTALIARIEDFPAVTRADIENVIAEYHISGGSEEISGLYPALALIAATRGVKSPVRAAIDNVINEYRVSGTMPQTALYAEIQGILEAAGIEVDEPDRATLAFNDDINATPEVSSTDCGVNYTPCGTSFSGIGG